LKRSTGSPGRGAKGFILNEFLEMSTGEESGMIISYSTGKGDRGLALNYCPFCGFSFHALYKNKTKVGDLRKKQAGEIKEDAWA
jgi:hypothetical protein